MAEEELKAEAEEHIKRLSQIWRAKPRSKEERKKEGGGRSAKK